MGGDPSKLGAHEATGRTLILEKLTLFEENGSRMNDICPFLDKTDIVVLIVDTNAIKSWRLEHTHISVPTISNIQEESSDSQIGVTQPLDCFVSISYGTKNNLRIQVIG
jgi:hypothetical protein